MDDQMPVGVLDGTQYLLKQLQPLTSGEQMGIAVAGNRLAIHKLECQIGLAGCTHACVVQPCNMRMRQRRKDLLLATESLDKLAAIRPEVRQLECNDAV